MRDTELRYPYHRPEPPGRAAGGEAVPGISAWLEERLFDRRVVLLRGPLNGPAASQATTALLTLDALGSQPVQLQLASAGWGSGGPASAGDLAAAFAVVDAIDAMRAPVHAVVTDLVGGAALAVLAAADRRLAYPHARILLAEPRTAPVAGTADEVAAAAGQYLRELEELAVRLAAVTGQPRPRVEDDLAAGRMLTAEQAREYGLLDDVVGGPHRPV
ncbi:MAG: ATP-dependent Clp protease proteolytic subunit [Micromonosporaceae bacterium]|nr:ATP-dependent Clp protease proteolytic subunit [Micromonosporaceae bacterium]